MGHHSNGLGNQEYQLADPAHSRRFYRFISVADR